MDLIPASFGGLEFKFFRNVILLFEYFEHA